MTFYSANDKENQDPKKTAKAQKTAETKKEEEEGQKAAESPPGNRTSTPTLSLENGLLERHVDTPRPRPKRLLENTNESEEISGLAAIQHRPNPAKAAAAVDLEEARIANAALIGNFFIQYHSIQSTNSFLYLFSM